MGEALRAKRAAASLIAPDQFFGTGEYEGKYSRYDERGVPTHSADGVELPKSALKKLEKIYAAQAKKYAKVPEHAPEQAVPATENDSGQEMTSVPDVSELPPLPKGACLPEIKHGTFGGRQGFEMTSAGPFTHMFAF